MSRSLKFGRYDYAAFGAFTTYSVCSLVIPLLLVPMGKSLDFPLDAGGMGAGGVLHAVRSAFMILTLLCCGVIAGRLGKRISIGLSLLLCGLGITGCAFTAAYWMLLPCLILAGLGEGVCEGLLTPFIQDLHPKAPERYVNIGHSFWSVGIVVAVIGIGGLVTLGAGWRFVLAAAGLATVAAAMAFLWKENKNCRYPETGQGVDGRTVMRQTKEIICEPHFWLCSAAMFFGAGAEFGLTFWAAAFIELTFETGTFVAGLGTGAIAAGMFCGRTFFGYIAKPGNLKKILLYTSLGTIPLTFCLALLKPGVMPGCVLFPLLFVLLFLCGIGVAPYWPTMQVFGVNRLKNCDSTMLYIYFSAMGIPGCGIFSWLMGVAGDTFGATGTILVVPACLIIYVFIIYCECWRKSGKSN
ncbi:MAG: MFS transporter [Lentisphaeria bacterium]|nr:MFS transporter [Lentisphaeria bacterium]